MEPECRMAFSKKMEANIGFLFSFFGVEVTKDACPMLSEVPGLCPLFEALVRQIGRLAPCDALVETGGLLLSVTSLPAACVETRAGETSL